MELELKKECLDTYELGEPQTLTQEETAETIVPDYCPDIARIISAEGVVCLHGGTEQDGQGQKQSSFTGKVAGGGNGRHVSSLL